MYQSNLVRKKCNYVEIGLQVRIQTGKYEIKFITTLSTPGHIYFFYMDLYEPVMIQKERFSRL